MIKHIRFPKISDFKSVVKNINLASSYVGRDELNNPIYDPNKPKAVVTFKGTVKLHGTNSGVSYNKESGFWYQSHESIITVTNDNYGFAFFAESNKKSFMNIINQIYIDNNISDDYTVTVYGEYVGKGIQKGVAISELDKSFFLFGIKISKPEDIDFKSYWVDCEKYSDEEHKIYNVNKFKTFSIDIDFNKAEQYVNQLIDITNEVEKECPIAKEFGISGVGEGVVWVGKYGDSVYKFKVKGEKHSNCKVKKLVSVDMVKLKSIDDFIEYAVTDNRILQGIDRVSRGSPLDKKMIGDVIRWVLNDVITEEGESLIENGLEPNDVNKSVSIKVRNKFFEIYNENVYN